MILAVEWRGTKTDFGGKMERSENKVYGTVMESSENKIFGGGI